MISKRLWMVLLKIGQRTTEGFLLSASHLLNLQIELVALGFVQTQQVPQLSFLVQPAHTPHLFRRVRGSFFLSEFGDAVGSVPSLGVPGLGVKSSKLKGDGELGDATSGESIGTLTGVTAKGILWGEGQTGSDSIGGGVPIPPKVAILPLSTQGVGGWVTGGDRPTKGSLLSFSSSICRTIDH